MLQTVPEGKFLHLVVPPLRRKHKVKCTRKHKSSSKATNTSLGQVTLTCLLSDPKGYPFGWVSQQKKGLQQTAVRALLPLQPRDKACSVKLGVSLTRETLSPP